MKKLAVVIAMVGWVVGGDWLFGASMFVLMLGWIMLQAEEGPPVLALAYTLQWVTISIGMFYVAISGRQLQATIASDYRPMVAIGLGCLVALLIGLLAGQRLAIRAFKITSFRPAYALSFKTLLVSYAGAVAMVGAVNTIAWELPSVTQGLIALTYLRLGLLYLVLRHLVAKNQWYYMIGLLAFEVALGITGFYAGFREPLIMAFLAFLERFDRRKPRHWVSVTLLVGAMCALGIAWMNVRVSYRERFLADDSFAQNRSARFDSIKAAAQTWAGRDASQLYGDMDQFIDRLWAIYYPALAVSRVPKVLPHTDGRLMIDTLQFVFMPRMFFPDKRGVGSDSELVRKYSGVHVAGEKEDTNIAFGYAIESYIDFGIPWMFAPVLIWGIFMGFCYGAILRGFKHRDIAVAIATVICWLSLYLFERSWAKTIGLAGTLLIYVGGVSYILDRVWYEKFKALHPQPESEEANQHSPVLPRFQPHLK